MPIAMPGTGFQQDVWNALLRIPCGETRSYRELAEALGRPRAVRAVGRANGHNALAITWCLAIGWSAQAASWWGTAAACGGSSGYWS
jgi:O-6-methylguanine DNA methyltransferase